jgi:hypothetical protein
MNEQTFGTLVNAGSAGAVLLCVVLFLKHLRFERKLFLDIIKNDLSLVCVEVRHNTEKLSELLAKRKEEVEGEETERRLKLREYLEEEELKGKRKGG